MSDIDPKKGPYTGQYGFVLLPERPTTEVAIELAEQIPGNELDLRHKHQPHLTLYHTNVNEAPDDFIDECLAVMAAELPCKVFFDRIDTFGGKFVFWHARRYPTIVLLHDKSLAFAKYFDDTGLRQVDRESLQLHEVDKRYVRRYGHPLVLTNWQPHITIGYVPAGSTVPDWRSPLEGTEGRFTTVAFAKIGAYGTIEKIVKEVKRDTHT